MNLADRLSCERRPAVKGPRCTVCALLEQLSDEDADALAAALADPTMTTAAIARAVQADGHHMTQQTLSRHRRGDCVHR